MWHDYYQPATVGEALALLAQYGEQARLIAGGTDLIIEIERKMRSPRALIDVSRISGLDAIHVDGDRVRIGAGVTHQQVVAHPLLRERAFALAYACWQVSAPQIRNRATVAGNLVTASPANDTIPPLWTLDATVSLRSARGERALSLQEFYQGVRRTALAPDEMLTEIAFSLPPTTARGTFLKLGLRRAHAIAIVNAAVQVDFAGDRVRTARIALGSVAPTIVAAQEAEQFLAGKRLDDSVIAEAARLAQNAARPIDDVRGPATYRRDMVGSLAARALRQLRNGAERVDLPARPVMLWGKRDGHFPPLAQPVSRNAPIATTINGTAYSSPSGHHKTLLRFLREDLRLTGTKEGCAEGECGACTVLLDGIAVIACMVPAGRAHGASIVTVEGVGANGALHPFQRELISGGGVQCGYCTPGIIVSGVSLLDEMPAPGAGEARQALAGNLCRCTGYRKIVQALARAGEAGR